MEHLVGHNVTLDLTIQFLRDIYIYIYIYIYGDLALRDGGMLDTSTVALQDVRGES
jgi:hypothetical protein